MEEDIKGDVELLYKESEGDASYPYHSHNGYEIYFFLSGNIRVFVEDACFLPRQDSVLLFAPHQLHRIQSIDERRYCRYVLTFSEKFLKNLSEEKKWLLLQLFEVERGQVVMLEEKEREELTGFCKEIVKFRSSLTKEDLVRRNAYLELLLVSLNLFFVKKRVQLPDTMPDEVVTIMRYIDERIEEGVDFAALSKRKGTTVAKLRTLFRQYTGLTLRQYLLERKILMAKRLLQDGASVTEACFMSGFNDYANFIRSFKKQTGFSPKKYR